MAFENVIAVITGGSSGIGLALAKQLAAQGAHVWLVARDEEKLQAALSSVQEATLSSEQNCGYVKADVSLYEQVEQAFKEISEKAGTPDLVINSAGVVHPGRFVDLELEKFHWMMDINYFGTLHTIKAVLPAMLSRGSGYLVNISSAAGFAGLFGYSAYGSSKYAVSGLSDVLRAELKPEGITVSIVFPPDTDTPQLAYENQFKPPETKALAGAAKPMTAEQVAKLILRDIQRGKYLILPGDTKLLFKLQNLLGGWLYPLMDFLIRNARRNH
ncbi:MAG: SDR family oxidoreductase [Anaerolineales bacterium]|nr:SDR family oxidoreductase [Anaerolineales bacterium]